MQKLPDCCRRYKKLWIRGAPAIGIAAAMGIALGAQEIKASHVDEFVERLQSFLSRLYFLGEFRLTNNFKFNDK